jgi:AAA+ ATPase superfamily predicted ATPase
MIESPLIDREVEVAELRELSDSKARNLSLLYGRRRVGKTYLLTHLWDSAKAFYFTASATSPEINRRVLVEEAAKWCGQELRPEDHPTWRTVFRALLELAPDRNLVLVIDELQYLASDEAGLAEVASELNAVWEGRLNRTGGLLLVLSGSAVRTLGALTGGGSPLYGRLDWVRQLHPFDYFDAGKMVPAYSPANRIRAYAAFGGVPKYLQAVKDHRPLENNIVRLLLDPHGEVRLQLETVLRQEEGLRDFTKYQGILEAVGLKRREVGEIAAALGQPIDTALRRMVALLVELGLLDGERNFEEARNQAVRYRIADPALRFHFGLVMPNESAIASSGAETVWRERLAKQLFPSYVGKEVFEDVVRQGYFRHRNKQGLPPVEEWGRWEGQDRDRKDVEIDLVARLLDGRVMTGSAKFRRRAADATVLIEHLDALRRLADSGRAWAHDALKPDAPMLFVSAGGFKDSFREVARDVGHQVITWTLDELF